MFVAIDGVAGAGKTTQAALLKKKCNNFGIRCYVSSAYEGEQKAIADEIMTRFSLQSKDTAITFLFQMLYSLQYYEVLENLKNVDFLIADRWNTSFFAYHLLFGEISLLGEDFVKKMDCLTFKNLNPDRSVLIDVSPKIAYERYYEREKGKNVLSLKSYDFFERTVDFYRNYAKEHNWLIVNGEGDRESVAEELSFALKLD